METLRSRLLLIPAMVYGVIALACTQIPLLNYLGYEFSALIAIVASCIGGFLTIALVRKSRKEPRPEFAGRSAAQMFVFSLLANGILLVIPLTVILTNALFVRNCSITEGIGFFLLLPVVSAGFACSVGLFCVVHYRKARTVFVAIVLATLVYAAGLGYFTPAVHTYNFFYGYFPGLTYDEMLGMSGTLVLYRCFTLVLAVFITSLALLLVKHSSPADTVWRKGGVLVRLLFQRRRRLLTLAATAFLVLVYIYRGDLGFESTAGFIRASLGSVHQTEHFRIYYARESYTVEEIQWVGAEHEFHLSRILDVLNLPFSGTLESYIYPSADLKRKLIGAGATNIAKPWSGQIHITASTLGGTLKHELVHVVAAPFGVPVLRVSLSTGLVEGLAMAIEWDWGNRTLHTYAAGMRRVGIAPDVNRIMAATGFATQTSSVSYVLAGSFCRFLIDRFGIRKMMQIYRTGDYERTYGRSLAELVTEWGNFLERVQPTGADLDAIDVMFRRPPIFRLVCARVIAERNAAARAKFGAREYAVAATLYAESYREGRGFDALTGRLASSLRMKDYDVLISALDTIILADPYPGRFLPVFIMIGDAFRAEGNTVRARELYQRVEQADFSDAHTEAAILRRTSLELRDHGDPMAHYFLSDVDDSTRVTMIDSLARELPGEWVPQYVKGNLLQRLNRYHESLEVLQSFELGAIEPRLEARRLQAIGRAMFRLMRFQEAKVAFWSSLNHMSTETAVYTVNEWIERCEWMTAHPFTQTREAGTVHQE